MIMVVLAVDSVTNDSTTVRVRALTVPVTVKMPLLADEPVIIILSPVIKPSVIKEPETQVIVLTEKLIVLPVEVAVVNCKVLTAEAVKSGTLLLSQ